VPPLRERVSDIPLLVRAFAAEFGRRFDKPVREICPGVVARLMAREWPGNVRQLRNEIERAVILSENGCLDLSVLEDADARRSESEASWSENGLAMQFANLRERERQLIEEALERSNGNVSAAARLLRISRIMVRKRMERFGLETDCKRAKR
jgi:Nif-specific regulatory protein